MQKLVRCLFAALLFASTSLAVAQSYSYLGGRQPPEIYASNTWCSKTGPFTSGFDTITSTSGSWSGT